MSTPPIDRHHPVAEFVDRLMARLDTMTTVPLMSMSPEEKRTALTKVARAEAQLAQLKLRLLSEAERSEVTVESGAATAADWLAVQARQVRREARSDLRLAQQLEEHDVLSTAMGQGRVNTAQARAIVGALARLPRTGKFAVSADQRAAAEAHLVQLAADHDAKQLSILGRHIFEVIAPDLAEQFEGRALEQEEARALRRTTFTMWEDDEGVCHGRFRIPSLHGQMLEKMIMSLSSPTRPGDDAIDPDLPTPTRHGIAFSQLIEAVPGDRLPASGGCGATVVVTMTLEHLLGDLDEAGVCTLDTGGRISASEARRLACAAGIVPMVLGERSQVLDLGRKRRLHTEGMRLAMGVRDRGCTAEHCQTPAGRCHAHHEVPWSRGGATSVDNGRLLCPHHHRRMHDPRYGATRLPDGTVRFNRRE